MISVLFIGYSHAQEGDWYNDDGGYAFQGLGTEANPYEISSEVALAYLAEQVNESAGESFEGKYFILTDDLDLGAHYWVPIGKDPLNAFRGILDGNGKTIYNLYIRQTENAYPAAGLFGYMGNGAKIEHLTIEGGTVEGCGNQAISRTGCLAGYLLCNATSETDSIIIRDCHNKKVTVIGGQTNYSNTGGLIGEGYAFCDSDGAAFILIDRCTNTGDVKAVSSNFPYTGGIVGKGRGHGYCDASVSAYGSFYIRLCANRGTITGGSANGADAVSSTGGILGFGYATGDGYGHSDGSGVFTLEYCSNLAPVKGGSALSDYAYTYTGGIFGYGDGYGYGDTSTSAESENTGTSSGNAYGSGVFSIASCFNRGYISGGEAIGSGTASSTGGIFGFASGSGAGDKQGRGYAYGSFTLRNCYSFADISAAKGCIGGIGGWIVTNGNGPNYVISAIMQNCYAAGTINSDIALLEAVTGGIVGRVQRSDDAHTDPVVDHCLAVLSYLKGAKESTFRIAGQLLNTQTPAKVLTANYAYITGGEWVNRKTLQNGLEWTGVMSAPPISDWNAAGRLWNINLKTYKYLPRLRYVPNQQQVAIP